MTEAEAEAEAGANGGDIPPGIANKLRYGRMETYTEDEAVGGRRIATFHVLDKEWYAKAENDVLSKPSEKVNEEKKDDRAILSQAGVISESDGDFILPTFPPRCHSAGYIDDGRLKNNILSQDVGLCNLSRTAVAERGKQTLDTNKTCPINMGEKSGEMINFDADHQRFLRNNRNIRVYLDMKYEDERKKLQKQVDQSKLLSDNLQDRSFDCGGKDKMLKQDKSVENLICKYEKTIDRTVSELNKQVTENEKLNKKIEELQKNVKKLISTVDIMADEEMDYERENLIIRKKYKIMEVFLKSKGMEMPKEHLEHIHVRCHFVKMPNSDDEMKQSKGKEKKSCMETNIDLVEEEMMNAVEENSIDTVFELADDNRLLDGTL